MYILKLSAFCDEASMNDRNLSWMTAFSSTYLRTTHICSVLAQSLVSSTKIENTPALTTSSQIFLRTRSPRILIIKFCTPGEVYDALLFVLRHSSIILSCLDMTWNTSRKLPLFWEMDDSSCPLKGIFCLAQSKTTSATVAM